MWLKEFREKEAEKESMLWTSESHIFSELKNAEALTESLMAMVKSSGSYTLASAKENLETARQKAKNIKALIEGDPVLYSLITQHWDREVVTDVSRFFNKDLLTLKVGSLDSTDPVRVGEDADLFDVLDPVINLIEDGILKFKSFELEVNSLPAATDLMNFDRAELEQKLTQTDKEMLYS